MRPLICGSLRLSSLDLARYTSRRRAGADTRRACSQGEHSKRRVVAVLQGATRAHLWSAKSGMAEALLRPQRSHMASPHRWPRAWSSSRHPQIIGDGHRTRLGASSAGHVRRLRLGARVHRRSSPHSPDVVVSTEWQWHQCRRRPRALFVSRQGRRRTAFEFDPRLHSSGSAALVVLWNSPPASKDRRRHFPYGNCCEAIRPQSKFIWTLDLVLSDRPPKLLGRNWTET